MFISESTRENINKRFAISWIRDAINDRIYNRVNHAQTPHRLQYNAVLGRIQFVSNSLIGHCQYTIVKPRDKIRQEAQKVHRGCYDEQNGDSITSLCGGLVKACGFGRQIAL